MSDFVVSWTDFYEYVQACREQAIRETGDATDMRLLGKAQGKIELCSELLNLKDIFNTIGEATAAMNKVPQPNKRALALEAERARLRGEGVK